MTLYLGRTAVNATLAVGGKVNDVQVDGVSVVTNKVAEIDLTGKQDVISDLSTIRSGATAGATAVQPGDLATVATSGSYNDLDDKPTIPAAQVNSDWNSSSGVSQILNKPTLGTMAAENTTSYYTKTELDGKLNSAMHFKGTKARVADLPSSGQEVGDMWNVQSTGANYAWDGSSWDKLSENIDLSGLQPNLTSSNAGTGISITGSGSNVVISNTQTSAEWGNITGTLSSQTDLNTVLGGKVSKTGDTISGNLEITNGLLCLEGIGSVVASSTSRLVLGTPSNQYAYLTGNSNGAFGIYKGENEERTGIACYPGQSFFMDASSNTSTLGRSNNLWSTTYTTNLSNGVNSKSVADIISGSTAGSTAVQPSDLATVATSGSYNDLSNKPSEVTESTVSGWGFTKNTGTVTSVNNVSPVNGNVTLSIPTVNNATLTITQGGTTKGTFTANASSNVTIDLDSGGGSAVRNIGEIIQSTIPLTDAGLHLLDGSVINGSGAYSAFVTYIAGFVSSYPDLFTTEANWQSSVSTYGVCGKFVYDSTNNTVRLPKITGFTEGTINPTVLGDLVEAGLPNITGAWKSEYNINMADGTQCEGALYAPYGTSPGYYGGSGAGADWGYGIKLDASYSDSIYGNSTTVQPQAIKVLYYIVIATSTKTNIQVDIDEVMTDLNGKVDIADLAECTVIVETYHNGTSWYRVYSDGWCEQGGEIQGLASSATVDVVFLKEFADTNYYINVSDGIVNSTWAGAEANDYMDALTSTKFTFKQAYGRTCNFRWQACGYIR